MIDVMTINTETPEQKRDRVLMTWKAAQEALADAKAREMELRKEAVALLFPDAKAEGTQRVLLGNGYAAKLVPKLNYKLGDADVVDATCDAMAALSNEAPVIVDRLVKWSADISVTEYRLLIERAEKYRAGDAVYATEFRILEKLHPILTISPGAPTLEIEEPKKGARK